MDATTDRARAVSEAIADHDQDDQERALDELIEKLADEPGDMAVPAHDVVGKHEFICSSCHLILHRGRLDDRRRMTCLDCRT